MSKLSLTQQQKQLQKLSPLQIQTIKLIELPAPELEQRIQKELEENPSDIISQNKAFKLFGQGNVLRWRQKGMLKPVSKRPGKIEYRLSELRLLQQRPQDYFE